MTEEALSAYFHLPLKTAAKEIGVSETYLKSTCRKLGFQRWPFGRKPSLAAPDSAQSKPPDSQHCKVEEEGSDVEEAACTTTVASVAHLLARAAADAVIISEETDHLRELPTGALSPKVMAS